MKFIKLHGSVTNKPRLFLLSSIENFIEGEKETKVILKNNDVHLVKDSVEEIEEKINSICGWDTCK